MDLLQSIAELLDLALPVIAFGMMFGGIPAALLVFLLRISRPERSSRVWAGLVAGAGVWCVAGASLAAWLVLWFAAAEPVERFGMLRVGVPLWLAAFIPSLAVLAALLLRRPTHAPHETDSSSKR